MELEVERVGVSFMKGVMVIGAGLFVCQSGKVLGLCLLGHINPFFLHLLYLFSPECFLLLLPLGLVPLLGHLFQDPLKLLNLLRAEPFLYVAFRLAFNVGVGNLKILDALSLDLASDALSLVVKLSHLRQCLRRQYFKKQMLRKPDVLVVVGLWTDMVLWSFAPQAFVSKII